MKRLAAVLLTVLLLALPVLGQADATATISWQADPEGLAAWLRAVGTEEGFAETYAAPLQELMQTLAFSLSWSDDGSRALLSWTMKEQVIATVDACRREQTVEIGSTMLPGVVIVLDAEEMDSANEQLRQLVPAYLAMLLGQADLTPQTGAVVGDAFSGGVSSQVMTVDLGSLHAGWRLLGRMVYDDHEELIGISATLLDENEAQLATLSVGLSEDAWRAVLGYGAGAHTCFLDLDLDLRDPAGPAADIALYTDDLAQGFAAASVQPENCVTANRITWQVNDSEAGTICAGSVVTETPGSSRLHTDFTGLISREGMPVSWEEQAYVGDQQAFSCRIACAEDASVSWPDHSADAPVDVMAEDTMQALPKALDDGFGTFVLRLFKTLPTELLMILFGF